MKINLLFLLFGMSFAARADLIVNVATPKTVGQKAIVKLDLKNTFPEKIESARVSVFLLDEKGKMIGQSTKWVIGGTKNQASLAAGATNSFFFVITSEKPFATTNLATKVNFNRVVLEGGKLANPEKDVQIKDASK